MPERGDRRPALLARQAAAAVDSPSGEAVDSDDELVDY